MAYDFTDFTRHMVEITAWYQALLDSLYLDGSDRQAKELIVDHRNEFAELAATDASPAVGVAAVQWNRTVLGSWCAPFTVPPAARSAGPAWPGVRLRDCCAVISRPPRPLHGAVVFGVGLDEVGFRDVSAFQAGCW
ncbi:hypothetical protein [Streptomyces noursei]|uniref:Uncharacterized protein n=1 Tax=Streptomyces noursei TaxID=1971 RepID=A0A2N8PFY2_STRNR|nr:hypothetical protein [Streptomyces noursei]PNE39932.1 hypothetical protein AOB60_02305 [Streptomyces noursei]